MKIPKRIKISLTTQFSGHSGPKNLKTRWNERMNE